MTWFKVDDRLHAHPKALATSLAALGLWTVAGSWSSDHLTDGVVPDHVIPLLARGANELADELVAAGLWRRVRGGYRFHQWNEDGDGSRRNPTKKEIENLRRVRADAGRKGGLTSGKTRTKPRTKPEANAKAKTKPADPTRPGPYENKGDARTHDPPDDSPPPHRCQQHQHWTGPVPACRACADARRHRDDWHTRHPNGIAPATAAPRPPPVEAVLAATRGPTPDPDRNVTQIRQLRAGLRRPRPQDTP